MARPCHAADVVPVDGPRGLVQAHGTKRFTLTGVRAALTGKITNSYDEHFFAAENARLLFLPPLLCMMITEDGCYFPESFPKPWPYAQFLAADGKTLDIPLKNLRRGRLEGTWVAPFMTTSVAHLYHSLMDNYGRLFWLEQFDRDVKIACPADGAMNGAALQIHEAFTAGRNIHNIAPGLYEVDRLIVPPPGNRDDRLFYDNVDFVRDTIKKTFKIGKHVHKTRLYVSRADTPVRNLVNERALIDALRKLGFMAICPGNFSLQAQFELFASAEIIVGIHGMGLMPMIVASDCKKVIEYDALRWPGTAFSGLAAILGIDYSSLACEIVPDDKTGPAHWLGKADIAETVAMLEGFS